jgi:hypothetical protein
MQDMYLMNETQWRVWNTSCAHNIDVSASAFIQMIQECHATLHQQALLNRVRTSFWRSSRDVQLSCRLFNSKMPWYDRKDYAHLLPHIEDPVTFYNAGRGTRWFVLNDSELYVYYFCDLTVDMRSLTTVTAAQNLKNDLNSFSMTTRSIQKRDRLYLYR